MNIAYIRHLSKYGATRQERKRVRRNYREIKRKIKYCARKGDYFIHYYDFIHPINIARLKKKGFSIREIKGTIHKWEIKW